MNTRPLFAIKTSASPKSIVGQPFGRKGRPLAIVVVVVVAGPDWLGSNTVVDTGVANRLRMSVR